MKWMDSIFYKIMGKIADLIILNILWILFSLPLLTIGASTIALYSVTLKAVKDEETSIFRAFIKEFFLSFRKGSVIFVLFFGVESFLLYDIYLSKQDPILQNLQIPLLILTCIFYIVWIYATTLIARFENLLIHSIKNAWILCFVNPVTTAILVILNIGIPLLLSMRTANLRIGIFIFSICGFSFLAYLNSILLRKIFDTLEKIADR